ncbi:hypothetical protein [Micromonospora thermarum]|uniref:Uncharacterized protein n=1 Tax=Micromonospora thermarum TaxID=2720024 RepID=A0ABX0ZB78_9ACTN|nr:hypothetical protein [Micromonospora thermarum]NJP34753.1 hypothetical protein [Micromonospora thermarum]
MAAHGRVLSSSPDPAGEPWDLDDPAELRRRYPRLAVLFPLPVGGDVAVWETARP